MRALFISLFAAVLGALSSFGSKPLPVIPAPNTMEETCAKPVSLKLPLEFRADNVDSQSHAIIERELKNISPLLPQMPQAGAVVSFTTDTLQPSEGYRLTINGNEVKIEASTGAGFFYGIQTLKRLMGTEVVAGVKSDCNSLPSVTITDFPRFAHRGFMLDVSRHFFSTEQIKKMLRLLAAYKMNKFHWHLTDDQGWRLPAKEYPLLTTVGASHPANTRMTDFSTQSEYYTAEPMAPVAYTPDEIRDIVDYASKLNIDIIPEVEMPGHLAAAIAAYPQLSCHPDSTHAVRDLQGISKDVLDVSNPEAMKFVRTVIDCIADFFPYEIIHIGGDETPTEAWENSEGCRKLVEENGFTGANAEEKFRKLQNLFTYEINEYARSKGRRLMTWDEIVTAPGADLELAKAINPLVMAYDIVYDKPVEQSAELGLQCVYAPFGPYYINRRYSSDRIGAGRGRDDIEAVYNHPVPDNPNVIGTQAIFWTEHVTLDRDLEYLALPRLAAIAENAWIDPAQKNFNSFQNRIAADTEWLELAGYNYAGHQIGTPDQKLTQKSDSKSN